MSNETTAVERMRPNPEPLDQEWSVRTIDTILSPSQQQPRAHDRRRPWTRWLALGAAAVVALGGGAAVAAGGVPGFVGDAFDSLSDADVGNERLIALAEVPDGRTVAVFAADGDNGDHCIGHVDDWHDDTAVPASSSFGCGPDLGAVGYLVTSSGQVGDRRTRPYVVVYGESPVATATTVRVVRGTHSDTLPIAPGTGAFGAYLAPVRAAAGGGRVVVPPYGLLLQYVDDDGDVVGTTTVTESY